MATDVRRAVLAHLLSKGDPRFGHWYLVAGVGKQAECTQDEVWEALWSLAGDGLIYLNPSGQGSDNWRWRLSKIGQHAAEGGSWEPRDPDGFLVRLRREIPDLDNLVEMYFAEALGAFSGRCYLASSVMLGVAAERSFEITAEAYADSAVPGAEGVAKALQNSRSSYFAKWTEFRKRIEPVRNQIPDDLADPIMLDAVANLIRLTRNEAGHPSGRRVDEDTARSHLTITPLYLKKMSLLATYFRESPKN